MNANASVTATTDATQSDVVTTGGNGSIVVRTTAGDITLNDGTELADNTAISANGTGNILVQAIGSGTSITSNADVKSDTGNISIIAAQDVTFTDTADILTGSTGTITVEATTGSILLSTTSNQTTGSGDISLLANNNVTLGGTVTTTGNVGITATTGWIHDADSDGSNDISANALRLDAATGIGTSDNWIEIDAVTLNASSPTGSIYLTDVAGGIAVGLVDAGNTGANVNLTAIGGSIIESGDDTAADMVGNTVNLVATGSSSTIGTTANPIELDTVNLNASTVGGDISLTDISGGVVLGLVTTSSSLLGTVNLTALNGSILGNTDFPLNLVGETLNLVVTGAASTIGTAENPLQIDAGANTLNIKTKGGSVYVTDTNGGFGIGLIDTGGSSGGDVNLTATGGSITESGSDPDVDISAKNVNLGVTGSGSTIGATGNPLEFKGSQLNVSTGGGDVNLHDTGGIEIGQVNAGGTTGGVINLTVTDGGVTPSGTGSNPQFVAGSVNLSVDGTPGSAIGDPKMMLKIDAPDMSVDNPQGKTFIDMNNTAGTFLNRQLPTGLYANEANLPEIIVSGTQILGGNRVDTLNAAENEIDVYQFLKKYRFVSFGTGQPDDQLSNEDDDQLTLHDDVIQ